MNRYAKQLMPIVIGGKVLKNRLAMSRAVPTFTVGVEDDKPLESALTFVGDMAANGACIVPLPAVVWNNPRSRAMRMGPPPGMMEDDEPEEKKAPKADDGLPTEKTHSQGVDLSIRNNRIFYARMAEAVHNFGSLASMGISDAEPRGWDINDIPLEYLEELPERFAKAAVDYASVGVDVMNVHMSYGGTLLCRSLSPKNKRQDKYGGKDIRERAALSLEVFRRVKEVCPDCLLQVQISGEEPTGGYTLEDICEYARLCDGLVDIFQIRGATDAAAHPSGVNSQRGKPVTLRYSEVLKQAGTSIVMAPVGGYQNPDRNEQWLREGKCDMIFMSRAFFADYDYLKKIKEGRGEDVIPCLLCNKCHCRPGDPDFGCAVNPALALSMDPNFARHVDPSPKPRKVAVIGGGPAGMQAALTAARRGHAVTLYEASSVLGGQLSFADYADFKWPIADFRDYLVTQLEKSNVRVMMNTKATPALLKNENYSAILYAAGSADRLPEIPGVESAGAWSPRSVYGHADALGEKVVVIGGSDTGCETAWYLALSGKQVIQVSRTFPEGFFKDADRYEDKLRAEGKGGSLTKLPRTKTLRLEKGSVTVSNRKQGEFTIECDDIVACGGAAPIREDILDFAEICDEFRVIGDAKRAKDIRVGLKDAYTAAVML